MHLTYSMTSSVSGVQARHRNRIPDGIRCKAAAVRARRSVVKQGLAEALFERRTISSNICFLALCQPMDESSRKHAVLFTSIVVLADAARAMDWNVRRVVKAVSMGKYTADACCSTERRPACTTRRTGMGSRFCASQRERRNARKVCHALPLSLPHHREPVPRSLEPDERYRCVAQAKPMLAILYFSLRADASRSFASCNTFFRQRRGLIERVRSLLDLYPPSPLVSERAALYTLRLKESKS